MYLIISKAMERERESDLILSTDPSILSILQYVDVFGVSLNMSKSNLI